MLKIIKKIIIGILLICVVIGGATAGINMYMISYSNDEILGKKDAQNQDYDVIIVLGAMVTADGEPSLILRDRLDKGIELYNAGVSDNLLLSGDNGQIEYNEVKAMKEYVVNSGVPEDDVYLDYAGFSTYESMYRARDIFGIEKGLVVTQKYHLYRAVYIGNKLGMDIYGVKADDVKTGQPKREVREIFARVKAFFFVLFNLQPTYLGDPVSLDVPQE